MSQSESKCPVDHGKSGAVGSWWLRSNGTSPSASSSSDDHANEKSNKKAIGGQDPSTRSVASIEEAARYSQSPQHDQRFPLGTMRQVSSIPRGPAPPEQHEGSSSSNHGVTDSAASLSKTKSYDLPRHQDGTDTIDDNNWVYPSEQQLLNAMRRKGFDNVPESSIPVVLQIHNSVNESTWKHVLEYHQFAPVEPRLVRFQGRPNDLTPKAYLWSALGYPKPFDRHDWHVSYYQPPSKFVPGLGGRWIEQRYVIDFYESPTDDGRMMNASMTVVDVRPALDSPRALWLHAKRAVQLAFPAITNRWHRSALRRRTTYGTGPDRAPAPVNREDVGRTRSAR